MSALLQSYICAHILLAVSSLFVGLPWLLHKPTLKLKCARLLFLSCILSPLFVQFYGKSESKAVYYSTDEMPFQSSTGAMKEKFAKVSNTPIVLTKGEERNYVDLLFMFFFLALILKIFRLFKDLRKIRSLLQSSYHFKRCRHVYIKISDACMIPFSTRIFNKAYIVLPTSMMSSPTEMHLAIAHEGQHHRQGDCVWTYFMESMQILFWGNVFLMRWKSLFHEVQELSCDEVLVGHPKVSPQDYGRCLFTVAQTASAYCESEHRNFACTVGMVWNSGFKHKSFLSRRILMLSRYPLHASRRSVFSLLLASSALLVPLCAAYATEASLPPLKLQGNYDAKLQRIADEEISSAVKRYRARSGAIAIADARSGKILAFAESHSEESESWATRQFPMASTVKPFLAAAAIEAGVSSDRQVYDCESPFYVDGVRFRNSENESFPRTTLRESLEKSVNVCFVKVGLQLGLSRFRESLAKFGMSIANDGQKTESLQVAYASLGSSVYANLEGLTKSFAVLANKGQLHAPQSGRAVSEGTAESVTSMMEDVVRKGTARKASLPGIRVAGKTGTLVNESTSLALFGGYFPAEAPRYVSVIVIEDGYPVGKDEKGSGGTLAAPVFRKVFIRDRSST